MAVVRLQVRELLNRRGTERGQPLMLKEVASETGIAPQTLEAMIENRQDQVSLQALGALCSYLDCTPGDMFHYQPDQPDDDVIDVTDVVSGWEQQYGTDEFPRH
jgi:putative transcriptional regulator